MNVLSKISRAAELFFITMSWTAPSEAVQERGDDTWRLTTSGREAAAKFLLSRQRGAKILALKDLGTEDAGAYRLAVFAVWSGKFLNRYAGVPTSAHADKLLVLLAMFHLDCIDALN